MESVSGARVRPRRPGSPARWYAWFCGVFLLVQGASTLAARLFTQVDEAVPMLLRTTRMVPVHSVLHIATAVLAFAAIARGTAAVWWFAALFGGSYAVLGTLGLVTGHALGLGLQRFDHPFHILLGLLGIAAAWASSRLPIEPLERSL